jgi:CYTH domain-containing protein
LNKIETKELLKEIERKFKVNASVSAIIAKINPIEIQQAYLLNSEGLSVRIRIKDTKAYLTIKGGTNPLIRDEFEYEIPMVEAHEMLDNYCKQRLTKKRYCLKQEALTWEIDVFEGNLSGLIIAEIELPSIETTFELPQWIEEEVTMDPNYLNANLILRC